MKSIIELAREAGFNVEASGAINDGVENAADFSYELERFAKLVQAKTLEIEELKPLLKLVRAAALEEAAGVTGEFAQKWWSIHCASNKHMETTRKAHDDFCALQAAIRAMKETT